MSKTFNAGICQMKVFDDKETNLASATQMVKEAAAEGCRLVVLPEMFSCPYAARHFPVYAEPIPGMTSGQLSNLAREESICLVAGSIPERGDEGKIYNTSLVFDPEGRMIAKHRKMHLFDVDIPGGITFFESETLSPGQEVTTFATEFGPMGLAICYDMRFPELARAMALQGAKVIIYPAAFNGLPALHWKSCSAAALSITRYSSSLPSCQSPGSSLCRLRPLNGSRPLGQGDRRSRNR